MFSSQQSFKKSTVERRRFTSWMASIFRLRRSARFSMVFYECCVSLLVYGFCFELQSIPQAIRIDFG